MHEIYTTYIENNNILFIKQWMSFVNILSYLDVNMTIWNDIPIHIKMVMTTRYGSFILNINKKAVNHKRLKRYKASLFPTDRQIMQSDKTDL